MLNVLEELELAVGAFGEDGSGKGLHDLLYGDGGASELVLGGAFDVGNEEDGHGGVRGRKAHQTRPNAPGRERGRYGRESQKIGPKTHPFRRVGGRHSEL